MIGAPLTRKQREDAQAAAALEAEKAINEEVKKFNLEFAELSITMRELLGKVFIRGGLEALARIKTANLNVQQQTNENHKG